MFHVPPSKNIGKYDGGTRNRETPTPPQPKMVAVGVPRRVFYASIKKNSAYLAWLHHQLERTARGKIKKRHKREKRQK